MTISAASSNRVRLAGTGSELNFNFDFRILKAEDLLVVVQDAAGVDTTKTLTTDYTVSGVDDENGGTVTFLVPPAATEFVSIILDPDVEQPTSLSNKGQLPSRSIEKGLDRNVNIIKRARDLIERALTLGEGDADGSGAYEANGNRIENLGAAINDADAMTKAAVQALVAAAVLSPSTVVSAFGATLIDDATADDALVTLGGGTKGIALFKDTTNAAVFTELGITSSAIQLFLASVNAAAGRQNLGIPGVIPNPNWLDNSDMQVWQLGTTFNNSTPFTNANGDAEWTADRWRLLTNGVDVVDVAKSAVNDVPVGAKSGLVVTQQIADTKWGLVQVLDQAKSEALADQACSLSMRIKAPNDLKQFKLLVAEWTGTADAPTADPVSAWNGAQVRPTLVANWAYVSGAELDITVAGSDWETFELENFTMGSSPNNLAVILVTNAASFGVSAAVHVSGVKLELGAVSTPYESKSFATEWAEARRFFWKTFDEQVFPEQNSGDEVGAIVAHILNNASTNELEAYVRFEVPMLKAPTLTTFNPHAANANWRNDGNTGDLALGNSRSDRVAFYLGSADAGGLDDFYLIHASADARI